MAAKKQEVLIVVLDVGMGMGKALEAASQACSTLFTYKLLTKPKDIMSVVCCGTTETNNSLNTEMNNGGVEAQYTNVTEVIPLQNPKLHCLSLLQNLETQHDDSDFLDGLVVGLDSMIKRIARDASLSGALKRILIISNLASRVKRLPSDFQDAMVKNISGHRIKVEVKAIEFGIDEARKSIKAENTELLQALLSAAGGTLASVKDEAELMGMFIAKSVSSVVMYKGPLCIGGEVLTMNVRVYKKVGTEKVPALKPYSDRSRDPNATHNVVRETEYRTLADPDTPIQAEERIKSFKYGKQLVPVSKDELESLMYAPEKDFQILGFLDSQQIPRYHYLKEPYIVIPDATSKLAIAALCEAMEQTRKVGIARAKLRANTGVFLGVLTPFRTANSQLDCFIMNVLPFAEDTRFYTFPSLSSKPDLVPSEAQLQAVQKVIDSMSLSIDGEEKLCPDQIANPNIQRVYMCIGNKAIDPNYEITSADRYTQSVFEPKTQTMPGATEALEECAVQFPSSVARALSPNPGQDPLLNRFQGSGADFDPQNSTRAAVAVVGTATPLEDFAALISNGKNTEAVQGMGNAVCSIVEASIGCKSYAKAIKALCCLREHCVHTRKATEFNTLLHDIRTKYKDGLHHEFWVNIVQSKVTLVNEGDFKGTGVAMKDAEEFLAQHVQDDVTVGGDASDIDEDELEGME